MTAVLAYVGLGANLGDAQATLAAALHALGSLPGTTLLRSSSLYRTEPIDAGGDDYLNAVAELRTTLTPEALLAELQRIEQQHGRERPFPNAPRTLDLDLLLHGQVQRHTPTLTLPHPRMHTRAFVLVPLCELDAELRIPGRGVVQQLAAGVADQRVDPLKSC